MSNTYPLWVPGLAVNSFVANVTEMHIVDGKPVFERYATVVPGFRPHA